jgi:hypothetical protein
MTHALQDYYSVSPIEDLSNRRIFISIQPDTIQINWQSWFDYYNQLNDYFSKPAELSLKSCLTITIPSNQNITTSFTIDSAYGTPTKNCIDQLNNWDVSIQSKTSPLQKKHLLPTTMDTTLHQLQITLEQYLNSPKTINSIQVFNTIHSLAKVKQKNNHYYKKLEQLTLTITHCLKEAQYKHTYYGINHYQNSHLLLHNIYLNTINQQCESTLSTILTEFQHQQLSDSPDIIETHNHDHYLLTNAPAPKLTSDLALTLKNEQWKIPANQFNLAKNISDHTFCAYTSIPNIPNSVISALILEVNHQLGMPNTPIHLLDYQTTQSNNEHTLYLFIELSKKTGTSIIKNLQQVPKKPLTNFEEFSELTLQITNAVAAIENSHVTHHLISPHTIIQHSSGNWQLLPSYIAIPNSLFKHQSLPQLFQSFAIIGDISYISPDCLHEPMFLGQESLIKKDAWALGVTLYQIFTGTLPFNLNSLPKLADPNRYYQQIISTPIIIEPIPESIQPIIAGLLTINPVQRTSVTNAYQELVKDCLQLAKRAL